jgi:tRNA modification GTPase
LALIEAGIDFADEGDVQGELMAPALRTISALHGEIAEVLAAQGRSERLRDGLVVAIAGPPNVGKSTLINRLARREVAIVSPHAGTTRDVIEVSLDLGGYPVTVIDTAGIRDSDDPVEQEGVRRAKARAAEADLVLWLGDGDTIGSVVASSAPVWRVRNKIDLAPEEGCRESVSVGSGLAANLGQTGGSGDEQRSFGVSAKLGDGVDGLIDALSGFAAQYFAAGEAALISRQRHRDLLRDGAAMLQRAMQHDLAAELVAEELRSAAAALGRLLGRVDVEDVLGAIFSRFCIGK